MPRGFGKGGFWGLLAVVLVMVVCVPRPTHADDAVAQEPVVFQLKWYHSFQFAGYYAAKWKGYYRDEGLDVTFREGVPGESLEQSVISGEADYGVMEGDLVYLWLQGEPIVVVASIFQHSAYIILTRQDRQISSPVDLVGCTVMDVAVPRASQLKAVLLREGIPWESVTFIEHSQNIEDLLESRVDAVSAYITNEPRRMRRAGVEPRIIRPIDYGVDFYGDCLFTSREELRHRPDRVAAFRRASLRGWEYAMSHVAEMAEIVAAMPGVAERGITVDDLLYQAEQMQKLMYPEMVEIGHMNPGRWKRMADTYVELGLVDAGYSLDGFIYDPKINRPHHWVFALFGSVGGIVLVSFLAWIWTRQLRRAVKRSTKQLRESEEALRRSAWTSDRLRALLVALNGCGRLEEMLPHLVDAAIEMSGMDGGAVYLVEDDHGVMRYHRGLPAELVAAEKRRPQSWAVLQKVISKQAATDLCEVSDEVRRLVGQYGLRHAFSVPLRMNDQVFGVLNVATSHEHAPDRDHLRALSVLALEAESAFGRLKAEEEHRRLTLAMEQAAEHIVITDVNGAIQYVNPAFERVTGYSRRDVTGKNPRILKSGEHDERFYKEMWGRLRRGNTWKGRIVNKCKDGSLFTEEATISPMRDASGEIVSYVGVKRDITQEIELQEQLRQSQKMEAVGQLAGGMAHDFNNLLQVILGYTSLILSESSPTNSLRPDIEQVHEAALRAAKLTGQLLTFSRRQVMEQVRLDLNDVVENLSNMLQGLVGAGVELRFTPHADLWMTKADRGQLEQVLINICANARDAMPEGGRLTIETSNATLDEPYAMGNSWARSGRYVLLKISDTGCGMDAATRHQMFDPFFTTKEIGRGTGMGLATVYGIVTQHRGLIHARSALGKGTQFEIYLPADQGVVVEEEKKKPQVRTKGGTETILVAEDEEAVRLLTTKFLRGAGYKVLEAVDGSEALKVLEVHGADIALAVIDVVMPLIGGRAVYDVIAKKHPHVQVIFVSGYSPGSLHTNFAMNEGLDLIKKPFHPNELLRMIRDRLQSIGTD